MAQLRQGEGVGQAEDVAAVVQVQVGVEVARAQPHHGLDLERLAEITAMFDNVWKPHSGLILPQQWFLH